MKARRLLVLAGVLGLFAAAWYAGVLDRFRDLQALRQLIAALGPWSYVFFLASFGLLHPLGIPAFFWIVSAGILWPFWMAFSISLAGMMVAASLGFLLARYIARDWIAARLTPRLRRFDQGLAKQGLRAVVIIRLVLLPSAPTHWALGLSGVGFRTYALGTAIGSIPIVAAVTYFGEHALEWLVGNSAALWVVAAALIGAAWIARSLLASS